MNDDFLPGDRVRVIRHRFKGKVGTVRQHCTVNSASAIEIHFSDGGYMAFARSDLEIIDEDEFLVHTVMQS